MAALQQADALRRFSAKLHVLPHQVRHVIANACHALGRLPEANRPGRLPQVVKLVRQRRKCASREQAPKRRPTSVYLPALAARAAWTPMSTRATSRTPGRWTTT
jgi:hypothetical protein